MAKTKNILITGATGNLGSAIINYVQTLGDLSTEEPDWHITAWSRHGARGSIALDLTHWYASAYELHRCPEFDLVVMTHGIHSTLGIAEYTPEQTNLVLQTNLTSCIALTHHLVAMKRLNPGALLIYCSSIQANVPRKNRGLYAIAKAGIEALAKSVAQELAPAQRAVVLRLGSFTTPMNHEPVVEPSDSYLTSRCLVSRLDPAEVAKFCVELYDHKSLTGTVIDYDAGMGRNIW